MLVSKSRGCPFLTLQERIRHRLLGSEELPIDSYDAEMEVQEQSTLEYVILEANIRGTTLPLVLYGDFL